MRMRPSWVERLRLPIIAAPMFLGSGVALVTAACKAGVVGTFPAGNARTPEQLNDWFDTFEKELTADPKAAPFGVNLVLARGMESNPIIDTCVARKPPIVITSIGDPAEMAKKVH